LGLTSAIKGFLKHLKIFEKLNINIIVANKSIVLNRSNFNTLPFDETTERLANELFEHDFGFGRADLAEQQSELASLSLAHEQIIKALKPYLTEADRGALVAAATVVRLEDKNDAESKRRSHELLDNLRIAYGIRGRKIYNMLRSRVYEGATIFHSIILPFLDDVRKRYPDDQWKVRGIFSAFLDDLLRYYPRAIWVNISGSEKTLKRRYIKVLGRINKEQAPVSIYARTRRCIKAAQRVCELVVEARPDLEMTTETYTLGLDVACMFTILKKSK
jgi:hypothetical protein